MSDDIPAILALDKTLRRYKIDRSAVSEDNRMKLDIHCPQCYICGMTEDQTGEILLGGVHRSCRSHAAHGGKKVEL